MGDNRQVSLSGGRAGSLPGSPAPEAVSCIKSAAQRRVLGSTLGTKAYLARYGAQASVMSRSVEIVLILMDMQRRAVAGLRDDLDERICTVRVACPYAYQALGTSAMKATRRRTGCTRSC